MERQTFSTIIFVIIVILLILGGFAISLGHLVAASAFYISTIAALIILCMNQS